MDYVKRVISLEASSSRTLGNNYGEVTATTFNVPIFLTQKFDDIGMYCDTEYISVLPLVNPPDFYEEGHRPVGVTVDMYYTNNTFVVTGTTTDKLNAVRGPIATNPFIPGINQCRDTDEGGVFCKDNSGNWLRFDGVTSYNPSTNVVEYVLGGDADPSTGNYIANGITYTTFLNELVGNEPINDIFGDTDNFVDRGGEKKWYKTIFSFTTSGRNSLNTTLSALTKQEEFLGVVFPQEVQSQVFIDRGAEDIFEKHMIMSEIKTVNEIDTYRNGYLVNNSE